MTNYQFSKCNDINHIHNANSHKYNITPPHFKSFQPHYKHSDNPLKDCR